MAHKRRVLVVDDDELTLQILRTILDLEEFDVTTVPDGERALQLLAGDARFDAVVLDVMMPGIDGFEVCQRIRHDPRTAGLPVVLLTARDLDEDRARGEQVGCDAYLTKPFSPLQLIDELGDLVARGRRPPEE
ncbi:MAG TPA: response regulator [Nitriliruptorales bacterium]|nr:response regulator [Nitriliruptorales bacterium]